MKQSFINKIALCEKCGHAFMIDVEGDEETCDNCLTIDDDIQINETSILKGLE
jgi:hypothetical protein